MRSNDREFPMPPGGPAQEFTLAMWFMATLRAIRDLPETPHPGLGYAQGPPLRRRDDQER